MGVCCSIASVSIRSVALSSFVLLAGARAPSAGQGVKLNDPLARVLRGGVGSELRCSPDGKRVVFVATVNSGGSSLFSAPTNGGTPVELAANPQSNMPLQISADSRLVHYVAEQALHVVPIEGERAPQRIAESVVSFAYVPGTDELVFGNATGILALPLEGGTPRTVAVAPAGSSVSGELSISSDGRWVLFTAGSGFYSAAVDGSTGPLRLNGDLVSAGSSGREITPDNLRVVYRGIEDQVHKLFSVPIDGSAAPVQLNGPVERNRSLEQFAISRDGSRVVYLSNQDNRFIYELYSAPIDGAGPAIKLNAPLGANRDVSSFQVADGGRVVYLADHAADGRAELFVVGVAGPATPVQLNHVLPAGPSSVFYFSLTADGRRTVYRVGSTASDDLFSVSIQRPGTAQRLNESGESVDDFLISPDSARVAYLLSETDGGSADGLYSVPIGGGARTRLDDGGTVHPFRFTPDARRVIYVTERDGEGLVEELLGVPSDGGTAPVKLYEPPDGGFVYDDVTSFQFAALGTHGTFVVELRDDDLEELYGVQLEPRSRPTLLATVPRLEASPGSPSAVLISPDEEWVAYTMREGGDGGGYYWLFGVPMDGSRAPVQLNPGPVAGVRLGPDGRTLFYFLTGGATGLYRVPVDSSEPKQELTGWTLDDTSLPFELSVDGSTLVVLADALVDGERELFSLPSDGSSPPVQLNDVTAPTASRAYDFQITADGTRVIYALGDAILGQTVELFSVPIDASAAPVRIAGPLPAGTRVASFVHVPESDRVVYLTRDPDSRYRLWSVPTYGGAAPVPLHAELPVDANAPTYRVVSAGTQVVFRADLAANDVYELFVAPIDGSASPRRLNGTLVAGGDVHQAFEIDGTGTRVVYRADEKQDEVFELFSASLVAPAVPVQLTGPHVAGGDVVGFHTVPGGRHVVFTADHDTDDVFELYIAPVDQVKQARKLSGALVAGGDVQPSFSVEPGGNVVYIADQDEDSVNEVYLSSPTFPRASASGARPRAPR